MRLYRQIRYLGATDTFAAIDQVNSALIRLQNEIADANAQHDSLQGRVLAIVIQPHTPDTAGEVYADYVIWLPNQREVQQ